MTAPVAYKYLTALSDNDLLAEWDRVTDLDPPDYSLEAAIDYETMRRVGEPEVDGTQLLARKLHEEAVSAHNRELIDRIKELETALTLIMDDTDTLSVYLSADANEAHFERLHNIARTALGGDA